MAEYSTRSFVLRVQDSKPSIGNSETETPISVVDLISCGDSKDLRIIAEISSVSGGAGTIKVQQCHRKDGIFTDVSGASVTITADGVFEIYYRSETDSLNPYIRIVATTGGSDAFDVDALYRTRRL